MAKFYGLIGFGQETEVSPGVWDYVIVEKPYFGEIVREAVDRVGGETVLGDVNTANSFRIVADPYAEQNFYDMKYVVWNNRYWVVKQVEIESRPRMKIRIGGIYEGPRATPDETGGGSGK